MRIKTTTSLIIVGIVFVTAIAFAIQNKGAPEITLDGGSRGKVFFPHHRHQNNLEECNICHNIFPQNLGAITELKRQGKLEKKRVMNHCRGCHRNLSKKGIKAGPISCNKCHEK